MTLQTAPSSAPTAADLDAARLLLARLGVCPADLLASAPDRAPAPTFAEYIPVVRAAVSSGTRRVYGSYWNRITEHWGTRRLDEPTPSEINQLAEHVKSNVTVRRNARGGRGATEHLIAALRCLYRHAENDGHLSAGDNPARKVAKPRRLPSTRRAVPDTRLAEINQIAATTGNDPALDALLLRLHTETACRRGGALALRHASGRPITSRRYDHLWVRIGQHLPWVATQKISTHWLRHTTLTWVERCAAVRETTAFAGIYPPPAPGRADWWRCHTSRPV